MIVISIAALVAAAYFAFHQKDSECAVTGGARAIASELLKDHEMDKSEKALVRKEVRWLNKAGIPIEEIERVEVKGDQHIYILPIDENLNDEIRVKKNKFDIVLNIVEGDIENELIVKANGKRILDGKEVTKHSFGNCWNDNRSC